MKFYVFSLLSLILLILSDNSNQAELSHFKDSNDNNDYDNSQLLAFKRPSWKVGRELNIEDGDENSGDNDELLLKLLFDLYKAKEQLRHNSDDAIIYQLNKRPSWAKTRRILKKDV
jgi:hypothetical protein